MELMIIISVLGTFSFFSKLSVNHWRVSQIGDLMRAFATSVSLQLKYNIQLIDISIELVWHIVG